MAETADRHYGTGRRKSAVARVWLTPGSGEIKVNGRELEDYFQRHVNRAALLRPLQLAEVEGKMSVNANVRGGGQTGQAEALRHGISRALVSYNEELRGLLKRDGLLSRDARAKERKKYGQPGARKRYQFSKR
jgi:small subunit ribosomal protein S9